MDLINLDNLLDINSKTTLFNLRRTSKKRKLDDNFNIKSIDQLSSFKRIKKNLTDQRRQSNYNQLIKSTDSIINKSNNNQFKKRILKNYSNKKAVLLKGRQRRKSISKSFLNLTNLSIFDTKSIYRFKFEQIINKVFDKINQYDHDLIINNNNNLEDNILDLNELFKFNDDLNQSIDDDSNLLKSLKASFLGKGSFGKVFKTKLNSKCFAIKIGLSNSFYGCTGEQNSLILNDHPNVVKTHHILKLKIKTSEERSTTRYDDDIPIQMNKNISYHTMKYIIDLNLLKLIDLFPKYKLYSTLNVILMEYAGDLSLQQLIDDSINQKINKERRIYFARQIADALVYLKSKSIAHLDLKPANIIIRKEDDCLKLIDFGCSKRNYQQQITELKNLNDLNNLEDNCLLDDQIIKNNFNSVINLKTTVDNCYDLTENKENLNTSSNLFKQKSILNFEYSFMDSLISGKKLIGNNCNIGTISHTAPEIFRNCGNVNSNIFQADVYSFSIILWQLVTREIPYSGDNIHSIIYRVANGKLRPKFDLDFFNKERNYCDLTIKMWHHNPEIRPNIEFVTQILNKRF